MPFQDYSAFIKKIHLKKKSIYWWTCTVQICVTLGQLHMCCCMPDGVQLNFKAKCQQRALDINCYFIQYDTEIPKMFSYL